MNKTTLRTLLTGAAAVVLLGAASAQAQDTGDSAYAVQFPAAQPPATPAPAADQAPDAAAQAAPEQTASAEPQGEIPQRPTSGPGAIILNVLDKVCVPLVAGKVDFETAVANAGFQKPRKRKDVDWTLSLGEEPYQLLMQPLGDNNKNVCEIRVRYAVGQDDPIVKALNVWRFEHEPQLHLIRNDIVDAQHTTLTWDNWDNQGFDRQLFGLVLARRSEPLNPKDKGKYDEARIQYQVRPAKPEMIAAAEEYKRAQAEAEQKAKEQREAYERAQAEAQAQAAAQAQAQVEAYERAQAEAQAAAAAAAAENGGRRPAS